MPCLSSIPAVLRLAMRSGTIPKVVHVHEHHDAECEVDLSLVYGVWLLHGRVLMAGWCITSSLAFIIPEFSQEAKSAGTLIMLQAVCILK